MRTTTTTVRLALLGLLLAAGPAAALDIVWTSPVSGDFTDAARWTPAQVPGASDRAIIDVDGTYTVTISTGQSLAALTLGAAAGVQTLAVTGGTLQIAGTSSVGRNGVLALSGGTLVNVPLTVDGALVWTGGTISLAQVACSATSVLTMSGAGSKTLASSAALTVAGAATLAADGSFELVNNSTFTIAASGVLDLAGDAPIVQTGAGTSVVNSAGTIRKSAGATSLLAVVSFTNGGTVHAEVGTIRVAGTQLTSAGLGNLFEADAGAAVELTPQTLTLTDTTFAGPGTHRLAPSGPVTLGGTIAATSTEFVSGTVTSSTWTLDGALDWSGGTISQGHATVAPGSTLVLRGTGTKTLANSATLTIAGAAVLTGDGSFELVNNPTFAVAAGGVLDLAGDAPVMQVGSATSVVNNAGTIRKSAGTTSVIDVVSFTNTGTVRAEVGAIHVAGTQITSTGPGNAFEATAATTVDLTPQTLMLTDTVFAGPGTHRLAPSGQVTLGGTIAATNAELVSGTVTSSTWTLDGTLDWSGGTILQGHATVAPGSTFVIRGADTKTLTTGGRLDVGGLLRVEGAGDLAIENNARLDVLPGGTMDLAADVELVQTGGGVSTVTNAGTLAKTGGGGTSRVLVANLANTGTVVSTIGTLELSTLPGFGPPYAQSAGRTELAGGNLATNQTLVFTGGVLTGAGAVAGSVQNGADVDTGPLPGTLTVSGTYTQTPAGTLTVKLGGTAAGTEHDQLIVGGAAALDGTIAVTLVNGFAPNVGDEFVVMTYGSHAGDFASTAGFDLGGGLTLVKVLGPQDVRLVVVGPATTTSTSSSTTSSTSSSSSSSTTSTSSTSSSTTSTTASTSTSVSTSTTSSSSSSSSTSTSTSSSTSTTLAVVDGFILPKRLAIKRSADATRTRLAAAGVFDTGSGTAELASPATVAIGDLVVDIPGLVAMGSERYEYERDGLELRVQQARTQSSKARFRLRLSGAAADALPAEGPLALRFTNDGTDGAGTVTLRDDRYVLRRRPGDLIAPNLWLFRARVRLAGGGRDRLRVMLGLATGGERPVSAPDLEFRFGPTFAISVPAGAFAADGERLAHRADGLQIVLDYRRELLIVKASDVDLGPFVEGVQPVRVFASLDADARANDVRMRRHGARLEY